MGAQQYRVSRKSKIERRAVSVPGNVESNRPNSYLNVGQSTRYPQIDRKHAKLRPKVSHLDNAHLNDIARDLISGSYMDLIITITGIIILLTQIHMTSEYIGLLFDVVLFIRPCLKCVLHWERCETLREEIKETVIRSS
ncbi:hypothetical protein DPMN_043361 [Dreissena polymorpha]|uniref:Uncharacterized protein n=1 Tax=Dreissena polymorpha TaxID=45954 RepID=A0A9D4D3T0_DREPO|nr:hypothetical protein DPMN_043361 [Dreissena polymorpha]